MKLACLDEDPYYSSELEALAESLSLPVLKSGAASDAEYLLFFSQGNVLSLKPSDKKAGGPLAVDFCSSQTRHRQSTSGIRQSLAKAVGCKPGVRPTVLDATAGLGGDAVVLAGLGCNVSMIEKNPVVYALLENGLQRALVSEDDQVQEIISHLKLLPLGSSLDYVVPEGQSFDVVYLDPMFPERNKSAKVKKGMQYFHDIVGLDNDAAMLDKLMPLAAKRVVVKRPKGAPLLDDRKPNYQLQGKTIRYDVYLA